MKLELGLFGFSFSADRICTCNVATFQVTIEDLQLICGYFMMDVPLHIIQNLVEWAFIAKSRELD